jgi:NodT family efflux transporter outer membrane factor (OMF) lipoprotein
VIKRFGTAACIVAAVWLAACTVGPKYKRPPVQAPEAWKTTPPWAVAVPRDAVPKGAWWTVFNDSQLNGYEQQLLDANQSLSAAKDRLDGARALARVASAAFFPQLTADPSGQRVRASGNRPLLSSKPPIPPDTEYNFMIPFALSYEADLFGRVRRNLEAANASLQSTAADLANVQLVLTSELAADYFSLRELDAEIAVVQELVSIEQRGLELVQRRHEGGIANGLEVAQQAALLDATVAQVSLLQQQRAQYEHAIAVLTGNPASTFSVPAAPLGAMPPPVPLGVPSDVLERRPDISTYERLMAYQNAQVGIATTAFYPHITLAGSGGWQSRDITALVNAPSAFWSLGSDLLQPIFSGDRNRANLEAAKAGYNQAVANYREAVLTAFQQVEDGLSGLQTLSQALATQRTAVEDSRRALTLANNRYTGGLTTYLDVITAQTTLLNNERLATQLLGQQMVTSVYLVKALGGGWDSSEIKNEEVRPTAVQALQP